MMKTLLPSKTFPRALLFGGLVGLALIACAPKFQSFRSTEKAIQPKPPTCDILVGTTLPAGRYEEIGTMQSVGKAFNDVEEFKRTQREQICQMGGEVVVVEYDGYAAIGGATVYRAIAPVVVAMVTDSGAPDSGVDIGVVAHAFVLYEAKKLGISFQYAADVFRLKEGANVVEMDQIIPIPKGGNPPGRPKPRFRARLELRSKNAEASFKQDSPKIYTVVFKNGEFTEVADVAEKRPVSANSGFVILSETNGKKKRQYYVPISEKRSALFTFDLVTEENQAKQPPITESEQISIANDMADSLVPFVTK